MKGGRVNLKHRPALLIVVGGGFLMLVDTLLGWQSISVGGLAYSRNAWHGFWGVVLGLMAVAFLLNAITQAGIVEFRLRLPHRLFSLVLAPAMFVFAVIKTITDDHSAWPSYVGFVARRGSELRRLGGVSEADRAGFPDIRGRAGAGARRPRPRRGKAAEGQAPAEEPTAGPPPGP